MSARCANTSPPPFSDESTLSEDHLWCHVNDNDCDTGTL